ncbi:hypothetical protein FRC17_002720, partial [Serendipita sp. 399]
DRSHLLGSGCLLMPAIEKLKPNIPSPYLHLLGADNSPMSVGTAASLTLDERDRNKPLPSILIAPHDSTAPLILPGIGHCAKTGRPESQPQQQQQ